MAKYRKKSDVVDAIQFNYIDNFDGPKTCELAKSLGLSRHGTSALWEIQTPRGWHIVYSGDWIITNAEGEKLVCEISGFETLYEPVKE